MGALTMRDETKETNSRSDAEEMVAEVAKVAIACEVKKRKPSRTLKRICKAVEEIERNERVRTTSRKRGKVRSEGRQKCRGGGEMKERDMRRNAE